MNRSPIVYKYGKEERAIHEAEIIERIQQGETEAFRELVDTYGQYVFQIVYSVLRHPKDAEDVAQEVFLQVFRSLSQYRSQGFKTWLARISLHKAIDYKRAQARKREFATEDVAETIDQLESVSMLTASVPDIEQEVIRRDEQERIRRWINELPEQHRKMIIAFYMEEKSYEQIAKEEGIAIKTVESRLYRARDWIRKHDKEGWK